jgi:uracil-DNA glycosylase family 4
MDAKIALVGEAPGEDEVLNLPPRPFVGMAGKILNRMLLEAGINRSDCYVTNVCLERPTDNRFLHYFYTLQQKPKRRVPTGRLWEWRECLEYQLREVNPNVVVAFGNEPLMALMSLGGITKRRGSIYVHKDGYKVIPVVHPAAIMRSWKMRTVAIHDLGRALTQSKSKQYDDPELVIHVDPSYEQVIEYLDWLIETRTQITIDLETRGLHIACLGIGHKPDEALVIPFMRTVGHYWRLDREAQIVARLVDILRNNPLDGQNFIQFDSYIFWHEWGITPTNVVFDTMHGQHLLYPERFGINMGLDLGFLTSLYTDPVINYYKDEGKTWERKVGEIDFWTYCGKDVVATRQSTVRIQEELEKRSWDPQVEYIKQQHKLKQHSSSTTNKGLTQLDRYNNFVLPLSICLRQLQNRGLRVDLDRQAKLFSDNQAVILWMQGVINETVRRGTQDAISSLNVRSNPQMKNLLYDYWNLPRQYKGYGRNRRITADENALVQLKKHVPHLTEFFEFLLKQKEILQEQNFLKTPVAPDGRMRTVLSVSGTETGRLASRKPPCGYGTNFQNIKNKLRSIFIPDPGYEMWEVDASQAEARVVAVLAQQWDLVDLFERGDIDVHWENAKRIFELTRTLNYDKHNREHYRMRYLAKRIIHASNYGMSWYKFRQLLLIDAGIDYTKSEAEQLLETYHAIYPNIRRVFHQGVVRKLRKDRELVTPFGRSRIFYDRWPQKGEGELFRSAYAYLPQSTIVDMVNHALLDFDIWCNTSSMGRCEVLHQNHDSILYQVKPGYGLAAAQKAKELMERPFLIGGREVSIPCEFKQGMNWGDKTRTNLRGLEEVEV